MLKAQTDAYQNKMVQKHIKNETHFDLVLTLGFLPDVGLYLAQHVFKSPICILFPGLRLPTISQAMGNTVNPAILPNPLLSYGPKMDFMQRVINTGMHALISGMSEYFFKPKIEEATKELLGIDHSPDLLGIFNDAAFHIRVSHPVFEDSFPELPNTAWVAGLQTRPAKRIEDDGVRKWLDEAKNGVVYISFGTV